MGVKGLRILPAGGARQIAILLLFLAYGASSSSTEAITKAAKEASLQSLQPCGSPSTFGDVSTTLASGTFD